MTHPLDICRGCDEPAFRCDCVGIESRRAKALAALCRRLIDQAWGEWPEDARASLRRSNPEHAVVRAEAELAEIIGGTP